MNKFKIDEVTIDGVSIITLNQLNDVTIKITGHFDHEYPDKVFDPYFENLHKKLLEYKIKKVKCNIKDLTFINSSGIKSIINWIIKLNDLDNSEKYKIIFLHSNKISWQKTSLKNLCFLVPGFIEIK